MGITRRRLLHGAAATGAGLLVASCAPTAPAAGTSAPSAGASTAATTAPTPAAARPKRGGTFTLGNSFDVANLDPGTSASALGSYFQLQTHDRLIATNKDLKLVPGLAEKWEWSSDNKALTLTIRKGATYHDGTPVDGESIRWNIDRNITNPKSVHKAAYAPVDKVELVDPQTVRLTLKNPSSSFIAQLTTQAGFMSSRKEVERLGDAYGNGAHKGGSGPFMYDEIVTNDHVTLVRNPSYWGKDEFGTQLPYLDKVVIKVIPDSTARLSALRAGQVDGIYDIVRSDLALVNSDANLVVKSVPTTTFLLLIVNRRPGLVFSEPRYIQAVNKALDRTEILKVAYEGAGRIGYGPITPLHFAYDPTFEPYKAPDIEGAKKLVQDVGKGPLKFEIMYTTGDAARLQSLQLIQAQLKKADITVDLKGLPAAQSSTDAAAGNFPGMNANSVGTGNLDPEVRMIDFAHTTGRLNYGKYSNKQVDSLIDQQRAITDEAKRKDLLRQAEKIVVVDDPAQIWYQYPDAYTVSVKAAKGFDPHPVDRPPLVNIWLDK